ncbi:MAG: 5'-methylthioadenosine/adenosylhomocysteine nucleosidase [Kiritimatiellae bacterium]|nr:5'-methylthioadenosine/adenosylhomocysteine nucleosidase [Kiritimatiellia bacterium]
MNTTNLSSIGSVDGPPIALVAAMKEELDALLTVFPHAEAYTHFHTRLYRTRHANQELVIAQSGMGKVNAACTLALLLSDFSPSCVINTGCAGGLMEDQQVLDLVVPEEIVYTDVDITPLGFEYGQMMGSPARFESSPKLMAHFRQLRDEGAVTAACHHGWLGSADSFISTPEHVGRIRERFGDRVCCVDMEGAAIAHVCTRFGVPFLIIRSVSDVPGRGENALDFQTFLDRAAAYSASLCKALVERIAHHAS